MRNPGRRSRQLTSFRKSSRRYNSRAVNKAADHFDCLAQIIMGFSGASVGLDHGTAYIWLTRAIVLLVMAYRTAMIKHHIKTYATAVDC
jgi:hypothetical protein